MAALNVEEEVDDVAVLDHVRLAFAAERAVLLRLGHRSGGDQVVIPDDFSPNEAALDICVDRAGRLDGSFAAMDRPGAACIRPDGKEGHQAKQREREADDAV